METILRMAAEQLFRGICFSDLNQIRSDIRKHLPDWKLQDPTGPRVKRAEAWLRIHAEVQGSV